MRLVRLKIRNIASLRGEHEIDFLAIQKESPLFAITGETGSGKSTILNCIALALYGEVYKHNVNQPDVVTLGEKEGSIELIFQVKGNFYLADWRIRVLKQNGEPYANTPTATRLLYTIEGTNFSYPKTITNTNAEDLLNLDFHQFCKCIILNQGEFAKFLTSTFNERKDILEKLYPGELLDNISKELDQEKKALEKQKNDAEIELHTLRGDDQSGDSLKIEKKKFETELCQLDNSHKHFESLHSKFSTLFHYFTKFHENERRKSQIESEIAAHTSRFNELLKTGTSVSERYQEALKKQETEIPVLQTYLEKEGTLRSLEDELSKVTQELSHTGMELERLVVKISGKESEERDFRMKLSLQEKDFKLPLHDLKNSKEKFQELFDLWSETELLQGEMRGITDRLSHVETSGKELKASLDKTDEAILKLPENAAELEAAIRQKKNELQVKTDNKQRAEIKLQEIRKQIALLKTEIQDHQEKSSALQILITKTQDEILPLEATLKLQEVLNASQVCVQHALSSSVEACPVCESPVDGSRWSEIREKLNKTDLELIRKKFEEGKKLIFQSTKEAEIHITRGKSSSAGLIEKEEESQTLLKISEEILPPMDALDAELDKVRTEAIALNQFKKDKEQKSLELNKIRLQFKTLRDDLTHKEKLLAVKEEKLQAFKGPHIPEINKDTIRDLKVEVKLLNTYLEVENNLLTLTQELRFLNEKKEGLVADQSKLKIKNDLHSGKISEIREELQTALNGEKASDLIFRINQAAKTSGEEWSKHSDLQKKQELAMKDVQGRLYSIVEFSKEADLKFSEAQTSIRELGSIENPDDETRDLLLKLQHLNLDFLSPEEIFLGLEEAIRLKKALYKTLADECRMNFASISTRLSAWEKLQDRIQMLEMKLKDITNLLDRKLRLFEVLGRDELRTFVLALVEESLIFQTNKELEKLCQGRYEIIHQTKSMKMAPEFFILDKFREGGRRKVSTLSGGETFMVSIAMALALAEMTRGQAEIDSLFIDEGFGTLDQDSLEDVLDMLQQIQTRGLMVGIISHIKPLTSALPVNLVLNKKSDGTSTIRIQHN